MEKYHVRKTSNNPLQLIQFFENIISDGTAIKKNYLFEKKKKLQNTIQDNVFLSCMYCATNLRCQPNLNDVLLLFYVKKLLIYCRKNLVTDQQIFIKRLLVSYSSLHQMHGVPKSLQDLNWDEMGRERKERKTIHNLVMQMQVTPEIDYKGLIN